MEIQDMTDRDVEAALLTRCAAVAREAAPAAQDQREANVFRLASMVVRSQFPRESDRLMLTSEQYFAAHPNDILLGRCGRQKRLDRASPALA
jgi:hypothetical protein